MNTWIIYKNGNYTVKLNTVNGTKIRETVYDDFIPDFAESCDITITDRCSGGCEYCYLGSDPLGAQPNLLDWEFLNTIRPYTEFAVNGNDLTHPQLEEFLILLKEKQVITNITINQLHFENNIEYLHQLVNDKLIYGIGISLVNPTEEFIEHVKEFPNAVIHAINGILSMSDITKLADRDLKLLILGYKELNRGLVYKEKHELEIRKNQEMLAKFLAEMFDRFNSISFDNLALEQLNVKSLLSLDQWDDIYMGDEGSFTFYINLVDGTFGKNSMTTFEERHPILSSIDEMFKVVRDER